MPPVKVGERIEVQATTIGREGDAVAVREGIDVHVPYLLVGERALVRIENVGREVPERRRRAHALLLEVHRALPERVDPPCREHEQREGRCSGCPWMIAEPAFQRSEKQRWLKDEFGLEVSEVVAGASDFGYRWSSKRVARSHGGRLHLGSFRRGTHQVADMAQCLVDHPDIAACAREVAEAATQLGIEAYDERSRQGDLRYVWFKTNGAGDVLVTLITANIETRAGELAAALPNVAGVAWSVQPSEGNAIRGAHYELLRGVETISIELAGHRVDAGPLGFLQPNPRVAELAYLDLCAEVRGERAFDLYAGAGVTTELLRAAVSKVIPCEAYAESAEALGAAPETVEAFLHRSLAEEECPEVVVANPPRSGIGESACHALLALAERGLQEVRIMSCSPLALRRDLERLAPGFELVALKAYDTLPHTPHVELVAKLHARRRSE
jgi:23S rRNA (uracil1939-C5)-methyltransferase